MTDQRTITELTEELQRLRLTTQNIQQTIQRLTRDQEEDQAPLPERRGPPTDPQVFDAEHRLIHIGDQVIFLTRGLYNSTRGTVYKVSSNGARVTSRDLRNRSISRYPRNLRIDNTR